MEPVKRMQEYSKVTAAKPDGSLFAAFYRNHNTFKIFNDKGTLMQEVDINDAFLSNQDEPGFIYRIAATATEKYIYTMALNKTEEAMKKSPHSFKPSIEVWSWDGAPVQRFKLEKGVQQFTVSEKHRAIYGFSPSLDNVIYKYDLEEIKNER